MNYLAALLSIALMAAITTTAIFRADAAEYKSQLVTLKASYAQTAQKAKDDAVKQEQTDLAKLKSQSSQAISQALQGQKQAETALQSYLTRGNAASRRKDLSHQCFSVPIAPDLIP